MIIELDEYKSFLGLDPSDTTLDGDFEAIIGDVEAKAIEYLGRDIAVKDYEEVYDGSGTNKLILNQFPVNSVSKIELWEYQDFNTWYTLTESDYGRLTVYKKNSAILDTLTFDEGVANVRVSYNAGYETIPGGIKKALKELVKLYFNHSSLHGSDNTFGLSSRNLNGGASSSYSFDTRYEDKLLSQLDPYRAINV